MTTTTTKEAPFVPQEAIDLFRRGGTTADVVKHQIRNAIGEPASGRTARRWRYNWQRWENNEVQLTTDYPAHMQLFDQAKVVAHEYNPTEELPTKPMDGEKRHAHIPDFTLNAVVFDIETGLGSLNDASGEGVRLYCCSFMPVNSDSNQKPYTLSIGYNAENDKDLVKAVIDELYKYDVLIGHNIAGFDMRWLMARQAYLGLPPFRKQWFYYDTFVAAQRTGLAMVSKSLKGIGQFFHMPELKTSVDGITWQMVREGNREQYEFAIANIIRHCEHDIMLNRKILPLVKAYDRDPKLPVTWWPNFGN